MVLQLLLGMAWIARLYRCGRAGKLHVELGRAPEIVEVAVAVRCGRLVLSNLNKFYSVSSRSATTAPGHMRLSVIRACGSLPTRRLVRRGALYAPPVPYDDEAQVALTKILTEMPLAS